MLSSPELNHVRVRDLGDRITPVYAGPTSAVCEVVGASDFVDLASSLLYSLKMNCLMSTASARQNNVENNTMLVLEIIASPKQHTKK